MLWFFVFAWKRTKIRKIQVLKKQQMGFSSNYLKEFILSSPSPYLCCFSYCNTSSFSHVYGTMESSLKVNVCVKNPINISPFISHNVKATDFSCGVVGCTAILSSLNEFETHYSRFHSHSCSSCNANFPSERLATLHNRWLKNKQTNKGERNVKENGDSYGFSFQ